MFLRLQAGFLTTTNIVYVSHWGTVYCIYIIYILVDDCDGLLFKGD